MEREGKRQLRFVPTAGWKDLYEAAVRDGAISDSLVHKGKTVIESLDPVYLRNWLTKVYPRNQRVNEDWAEEKFRRLRMERGEWSLDGTVVDETGEVFGSSLWSTYEAFRRNADLRFTLVDLAQAIVGNGRLLYPVAPKYDTTLFCRAEDEEQVTAAIAKHTGAFRLEDYSVSGDFPFRDMQIRMARIRTGKIGVQKFAQEGIIFGKVGIMVNPRLRLGLFGFQTNIQRVDFEPSSILPNGGLISPLRPEDVKSRGGRLTEEKYPNVWVKRIDPELAEIDFIATSLLEGSPESDNPVVLRYTTLRPWLGEFPHHGESRQKKAQNREEGALYGENKAIR